MVLTMDLGQHYTGAFGRWFAQNGVDSESFLGATAEQALGAEAARVHEAANRRALHGETAVYDWSVRFLKGIRRRRTRFPFLVYPANVRASTGAAASNGLAAVKRNLTSDPSPLCREGE